MLVSNNAVFSAASSGVCTSVCIVVSDALCRAEYGSVCSWSVWCWV